MSSDTNTTTGAGIQAKEAWNQAAPFPITEKIQNLKVAVTAACECKTQLEAALIYAKFGIPVFPCNWKPNKDGAIKKYPLLGEGGLYLATTDSAQIQEWWTKWPEALIGVPMGRRVGMWAVDADSKEKKGDVDGVENWTKLQVENGDANTRTHLTGTNGLHFLYPWDDDRPVGCSNGNLPRDKIGEVKGEGGYVIFPPSPYTLNGKILSYSVSQDIYLEPAPDWLYDLIIGSRPKSNGPISGKFEWPEGWGERSWTKFANRFAQPQRVIGMKSAAPRFSCLVDGSVAVHTIKMQHGKN
jgi:Bifunctional DNA primase/polymerase, N-terminal